jgi:hypothetical protein
MNNIKIDPKKLRHQFWLFLLTGQLEKAKRVYINLKWLKNNNEKYL